MIAVAIANLTVELGDGTLGAVLIGLGWWLPRRVRRAFAELGFVRPAQHVHAAQVDVVADQDRGAGLPVRVETAAAVGEDDGPAPGSRSGADGVHHGADALALVEVGAA